MEQKKEIVARLAGLTPQSNGLWGSMNVGQMLTHCTDQIRICLGELPCRPRGNKLTQGVARWVALNVPLPMPKNLKTVAELDPNKKYMTQPTDFGRDLGTLLDSYKKMLGLPEFQGCEHPVFGKMTKSQAVKLTNIHLDHHLRQFGA